MNFLRLNIFFQTSTSEWMNMNTFILKQKEPWIHLLILIFIFIWTMFTYTHTHRHTDRHTNGRAQISLWYIYVCIYLLQQIMADWLSLALLVGVVAIYYGTLTPCRDSQIIRYAANWISISQLSVNGHWGIMFAMPDLHLVCIFLSCVGG